MRIAGTKLLSKNTEDLHGSPRWATKADIAETNLMQTMQGVYVGGWHEQSTKRLHYLRHNGPEHILALLPLEAAKGSASSYALRASHPEPVAQKP
jgi:type IV secretion system protein VirD4